MPEDQKPSAGSLQGRAIFISYRRDDSEGETGRLFDDLVRAYGDDSVFMDVAGIEPGLDFRKAIDANVSSCGVLLAVIGPSWASVTDSSGNHRINDSNDFVRLEIASALARSIPVIPVLVHGAKMPALDQLPDDLKDLRYRNSVEITHARWNSDVALLIGALKSYVTVKKDHETETVHATVPVQLPAPQTPPSAPDSARDIPHDNPPRKSRLPLFAGVGVAAAIVLAVVIFAVTHNNPTPNPQPGPTPPVTVPGAAFVGDWQDAETPEVGDNLIRLRVSANPADAPGRFEVNAWGRCQPDLCDWGMHHAKLNGDELITESWDLRNNPEEVKSQRSVVIRMRVTDSGLTVTVRNTRHPKGQSEPKILENRLELTKEFR
ncbi:toll/interleukin-1 receptor domain-containing protein [Acidicapsa acidisoli]|uniref:toll/interleukin-1 receptor domain-containing protein n=1 Tax=Acidicapsa acidisoli TaxID=1615681 RepID=UPI0021DFB2A5|nr:toll/interleukin-1 receptor domain-containing protein [Acidicapsa acidisoli]